MAEIENTQEQGGVTEQPQMSQRELFLNNIRAKHPELGDDEENYYKYATENYARKKEANKLFGEQVGKIHNAIGENPVLQEFLTRAIQFPNSPEAAWKALPKEVLQDLIDHYDDPIDEEEAQKALLGWREGRKQERERQRLFEENNKKSDETIANYAKSKGYKTEEVAQIFNDFLAPLLEGRIDDNLLQMLYDAKNRDNDLKKEYERGLTEGRNGQIKEKTMKRNAKTDGLPEPRGGETVEENDKPKGFFDGMRKQSEWDKRFGE